MAVYLKRFKNMDVQLSNRIDQLTGYNLHDSNDFIKAINLMVEIIKEITSKLNRPNLYSYDISKSLPGNISTDQT